MKRSSRTTTKEEEDDCEEEDIAEYFWESSVGVDLYKKLYGRPPIPELDPSSSALNAQISDLDFVYGASRPQKGGEGQNGKWLPSFRLFGLTEVVKRFCFGLRSFLYSRETLFASMFTGFFHTFMRIRQKDSQRTGSLSL
jgi:hypothetical protein